MAKYPELNGAPSRCLNTSPMRIDALKIRAPFGKTDVAEILQPGIVSVDWDAVNGVTPWDLFTGFWQGKSQDEGGVGWQSGAELKTLDKMHRLASRIIDRKDRYESKSKAKIVDLAKAARDQLASIASEYATWNNKGFPGKANYGIQSLALHRSEKEIRNLLDPDYEAGHIWPSQRHEARKRIRKAWDKALRFLWCAVYAANQSKAYLKNQEIGMQGVTISGTKVGVGVSKIPSRRVMKKIKVSMIPVSLEPDVMPGMMYPEEEEIVEEEIIEEEVPAPKKKKGMGMILAAGAAAVLLVMKR